MGDDNRALRRSRFTTLATAVGAGVLYGVVCQVAIRGRTFTHLYASMSFGFVFVLPFVLGFLTLWSSSPRQCASWAFRIFAPWATVLISLLFALLVGWEGAICMIAAAIIYLPLASVGGIVGGFLFSHDDRNTLSISLLPVLLLMPILSAFTESFFPLSARQTGVVATIDIAASPSAVWAQITRIPKITEPLDGFFYRLGFPKPVEATLSHDGIGGVRHASFERGLVFVETIDRWEPDRALSFAIDVDPASVPTTTLDEHVVVGGRYFDVLRGTYEIRPIGDGRVRLTLSSDFVVSTRFNFYAGAWARFLMHDIQRTILNVIKDRAEKPRVAQEGSKGRP